MPSKHMIISSVIMFSVLILVYNKVPAVKKALGGM